MKPLILTGIVLLTLGCGSSSAPVVEQPKSAAVTKLESMPLADREAYVKAHPEEFTPPAGGGR